MSLSSVLKKHMGDDHDLTAILSDLPEQILLTVATESTDEDELTLLARMCCEFVLSSDGSPTGLLFRRNERGHAQAVIRHHVLFEALVNNPRLPEHLRRIMVLNPGVQGGSEIVGEYTDSQEGVHIYEYLRRNSYIPWGHFAANMSEDSVRYHAADLSSADMKGLRHLYYQRTYARVARMLGIGIPGERRTMDDSQLEELRREIIRVIRTGSSDLFYNATLWGWNYGFSYAPAGYNLHASHQQVHQQFALIPRHMDGYAGQTQVDPIMTYGCGDQVHAVIASYRQETGHHFFQDYLAAIRSNTRMDGNDAGPSSLVVYEDDHVILFVPKAQTSQWELNLMVRSPLSNILETDTHVRNALDTAMLKAMHTLTSLGAKMITCIEFSGRFDMTGEQQHLLYAFLPKIPYSMGAFTEAQLRYINGHFPEDFAQACRKVIP
jgi:hypothetical protein